MAIADEFSQEQNAIIDSFVVEPDGYVPLGEICHNFLNEQTQYVSYHMQDWHPNYPCLTEGLRVTGDDEYAYRIHRDDVREFIARLRKHRESRGLPCA